MKNACLTFIFLCFASLLYGQAEVKTLLWKVSRPNSNNVSFLFGTFHEVNPLFFDSLTNVVASLRRSDILFVEERGAAAGAARNVEQHKWNPDQWNRMLTNEQQGIFRAFVEKAEDSSYYGLNPLMLSLTLSRMYLMNFCQTSLISTQLMDSHIEDIASNQGKEIVALDTNQAIITKNGAEKFSSKTDSSYAALSIHHMKRMLNDDLSDCEILEDYKAFKLDYKLQVNQTPEDSWLLDERNTRWVKRLEKSLLSKNCFIAVGFRHLFYKQGLIQRLSALGYEVTPVSIQRLH